MGNKSKTFTALIDSRNRIMIPQSLISQAKLKHRCVEFELKSDGIMMREFDPETLEFCALCHATAPTILIKVRNDEYLCPVCVKKIKEVTGGWEETEKAKK